MLVNRHALNYKPPSQANIKFPWKTWLVAITLSWVIPILILIAIF